MKLRKRLADVDRLVEDKTEFPIPSDGTIKILVNDINASMDEIFGARTSNARDFYVKSIWFVTPEVFPTQRMNHFAKTISRVRSVVQAAINRLEKWRSEGERDKDNKILRAYAGLDLHPEIARAANVLYCDGHYANAIEDAVKALNSLVRLRSGLESDGTSLMQTVFSPKNPILRFNSMRDQSDMNEQTGFMMMFTGAVAGLRNPRAHTLIKDDPERALEFIAFVSLLAKLLDGATKSPAAEQDLGRK